MASEPDESGSPTYELRCASCDFERMVQGELSEVLEVAESHEAAEGPTRADDHFVNLELVEGE